MLDPAAFICSDAPFAFYRRDALHLLRRAVRLVALPGALIADPFAGIASTGVAALAERCRFIGSEIDPRHHRLGLSRLRAAHAELA